MGTDNLRLIWQPMHKTCSNDLALLFASPPVILSRRERSPAKPLLDIELLDLEQAFRAGMLPVGQNVR